MLILLRDCLFFPIWEVYFLSKRGKKKRERESREGEVRIEGKEAAAKPGHSYSEIHIMSI